MYVIHCKHNRTNKHVNGKKTHVFTVTVYRQLTRPAETALDHSSVVVLPYCEVKPFEWGEEEKEMSNRSTYFPGSGI